MATTDSLDFEMQRRVILYKSGTVMPDGSLLGFDGDPNNAGTEDAGEKLIYNSPVGTLYVDDDGVMYRKTDTNNTWEAIGSGSGGSSYADSDVDSHLNITGASSGEVLGWDGSEYTWVTQATGSSGSSSTGGGVSPGYTTLTATTITVDSILYSVVNVPLDGTSDKFEIPEVTDDNTRWRINFTGGTKNKPYKIRLAFTNITPRNASEGTGNPDIWPNSGDFDNAQYFYYGWDGSYSISSTINSENYGFTRWMDMYEGRDERYLDIDVMNRSHLVKFEFNPDRLDDATTYNGDPATYSLAEDDSDNQWVVSSDAQLATTYNAYWYITVNGHQINGDFQSPEGRLMEYFYFYDVNGDIDIQYFDTDMNMQSVDMSDISDIQTITYKNQTVVSQATWWDTDMLSIIEQPCHHYRSNSNNRTTYYS
jgi:hypothetical protein